jgi:hypothetical protein
MGLREFFGLTPRWAKRLPSQAGLTSDQIRRLDIIRRERGATDEEFLFHLLSHSAMTKRLLLSMYRDTRRSNPTVQEHEILMRLILQRAQIAWQQGADLFNLGRTRNNEYIFPSHLAAIIQQYPNIQALTDAIVAQENAGEPWIGPPGTEAATAQVDQILSES